MVKRYPYNVLSDKKCSNVKCDKKLKKRIVEEKPQANLCYKCFIKFKK